MVLSNSVQLTEAILQHHLLEGEPRDLLCELASRLPEARELAQELLRRDWLTPYQVNQVFLGRARELTLGPFVVRERLGEGGMGQVFKAWQRTLERVVALKVIRRECLHNATVVKRFEREMQAIGQMRHPNIVHAYDAGQIDGTCFIAMEFIDGIDLSNLVKTSGPLLILQACDYIRQAALGLQHAHEGGLVHRDIKPANLFVTRNGHGQSSAALSRTQPSASNPGSGAQSLSQSRDVPWGVVKILDMGLARWTDNGQDRTQLTQLGSLMGTPDYIAPEQARNSHECDIRSDIYSLGCTFYFLLTGRSPFGEGTLTERLVKHQTQDAEPTSQGRQRRLLDKEWVSVHGKPAREALVVPDDVESVLRKMMAKKPTSRYQTPAELAEDLARILKAGPRAKPTQPMARPNPMPPRAAVSDQPKGAAPVRSRTPPPPPHPSLIEKNEPAPANATTPEVIDPEKAQPRRRRRKLALATIAIALACGMLIAAIQNADNRPQAGPAVPTAAADSKAAWEDEHRAELQILKDKIRNHKGASKEVLQEIMLFRAAHVGGPLRKEAAILLSQLPSSLDLLDRARLGKVYELVGLPRELVGILDARKAKGENKPFQSIAFRPDGGMIVAAGEDTPLRAWDTEATVPLLKVISPMNRIARIAFAPDGKTFAGASTDGVVRLWDASTRAPIRTFRHARSVVGLAYHPNSVQLATASLDGKIRLWNVDGEKELHIWDAGTDLAPALIFSPDGRYLFWAGKMREIRWIDLDAPGAVPNRFAHTEQPIRSLVFHPDGDLLIGGAIDGHLLMWTWKDKKLSGAGSQKAHDRSLTDLSLSPDGRTLVTVGADARIKLWDVATQRVVKSWELRVPLHAVAFAPDGRHFVTANGTGTLHLYRPALKGEVLTRR